MNIGKHSKEAIKIKELEETIKAKDREIRGIKTECAGQFKKIRELCFCNTYNERFNKLKKIYEISDENFSRLVKDLIISNSYKSSKIIELPTRKVK